MTYQTTKQLTHSNPPMDLEAQIPKDTRVTTHTWKERLTRLFRRHKGLAIALVALAAIACTLTTLSLTQSEFSHRSLTTDEPNTDSQGDEDPDEERRAARAAKVLTQRLMHRLRKPNTEKGSQHSTRSQGDEETQKQNGAKLSDEEKTCRIMAADAKTAAEAAALGELETMKDGVRNRMEEDLQRLLEVYMCYEHPVSNSDTTKWIKFMHPFSVMAARRLSWRIVLLVLLTVLALFFITEAVGASRCRLADKESLKDVTSMYSIIVLIVLLSFIVYQVASYIYCLAVKGLVSPTNSPPAEANEIQIVIEKQASYPPKPLRIVITTPKGVQENWCPRKEYRREPQRSFSLLKYKRHSAQRLQIRVE